MKKRKYLIISVLAVISILVITFILTNKTKNNIIEKIIKLNNYEIKLIDCNNTEKTLPKDTLITISNYWNELSNNGPWMGNNNTCYKTININYKEDSIPEEINILLVDESSLVLIHNNNATYYTNSTSINKALNEQYIK